MKEKILFIAALIGSFSATIILLINNALTLIGVDTTGYVNIINIVGTVLAVVILVVAIVVLAKYNKLQQVSTVAQNALLNTTLDDNASLMETVLTSAKRDILAKAETDSAALLAVTEHKINVMMTDMLPALAKQTMEVVTKQSQDIVEATTAKATATMLKMDELIPTYARAISKDVAQTVRENNAHYHKMLVELTSLVTKLQTTASTTTVSELSEQPSVILLTKDENNS